MYRQQVNYIGVAPFQKIYSTLKNVHRNVFILEHTRKSGTSQNPLRL